MVSTKQVDRDIAESVAADREEDVPSRTRAEPKAIADTLHGKIAEVQAELGVMPKDRHVEVRKQGLLQYSYDYLSESALMSAVREKLARRSVAVYVSAESQRREGQLTMVEIAMTFADGPTGETFTVKGQGQGADQSDKGAYKAITGAVRYALWKTFLVPTEGDDPNQPHEVQAERTDAPVTIKEAISRIELYVADARPWIKEAVENFYPAEVPAEGMENWQKLPERVKLNALRRLQMVVVELEAEPNFEPLADAEAAQALVRRAFAKAFDGAVVQGPDPFEPSVPF